MYGLSISFISKQLKSIRLHDYLNLRTGRNQRLLIFFLGSNYNTKIPQSSYDTKLGDGILRDVVEVTAVRHMALSEILKILKDSTKVLYPSIMALFKLNALGKSIRNCL